MFFDECVKEKRKDFYNREREYEELVGALKEGEDILEY